MYLIQSARIPKVCDWGIPTGVLGTLDLDYMGSAEFEWGAIPAALFNFLSSTEEMVYGSLHFERAGKLARDNMRIDGSLFNHELQVTAQPLLKETPVKIEYLIRKSQEKDFIIAMEQWAFSGNTIPKERVYPATPDTMHMCIDLGRECFFWNSKIGKRLLKERLPMSLEMLLGGRFKGRELSPKAFGSSPWPNHAEYGRKENTEN